MSGLEKPRSTRGSSSRASSPDRGMSRVISGRHIDDQYHGFETYTGNRPGDVEDKENEERQDKTNDEAGLSGNDTASEEGVEKESGRDGDVEISGAPPSERDLEAGKLEKIKTTGSKRSRTRDPNLVSWEGPDDPENPKNWAFRRKWAATLIGTTNMTFPLILGI